MPIINMVYKKKKKFVYEYDFANKSVAQIKNDWWSMKTESATFGNEWIKYSGWNDLYVQPIWMVEALDNAKKITLKNTHTQYVNRDVALCYNKDAGNRYWYNGDASVLIYQVWNSEISRVRMPWVSSWTVYTATCIIDLVNKTTTIDYWGLYSNTVSLTDSQITTITSMNYLWYILENNWLRKISIEIEL